MMDNRTSQICETCNSHIISIKEKDRLIFECSYCGTTPDNLDFPIRLEDEDIDD